MVTASLMKLDMRRMGWPRVSLCWCKLSFDCVVEGFIMSLYIIQLGFCRERW